MFIFIAFTAFTAFLTKIYPKTSSRTSIATPKKIKENMKGKEKKWSKITEGKINKTKSSKILGKKY